MCAPRRTVGATNGRRTTFMWHHLLAQLRQLRANTHIGDVLDVLIITTILYFIMLWFRRRASRAVLTAAGSVVVLYALARLLNMYLTSMLFTAGLAAAMVAVVIIFQPDIRRSFELIASSRLFNARARIPSAMPTVVDTLVSSVAELAESRVGALIVLQGRQALEHHTRGGVDVHGKLSHPLLCSIFDHHSPGHDGAVLIDQGRIEQLGVVLPLSNNLDEAAGHGTRHAAALGLSEQSDALSVVVSEERGTISIAQNGRLTPVRSPAILKQRIESFYRETFPEPGARGNWRWLHGHLGLKGVSLVLASVLWLLFAYRVETVYRTVEVPIEYRNLPSGVVIE
ncbi:MAG: hypothetical protein GF331_06755, partial [Chitinivibrionales bacterium]|nr:hypothetical protein [Chitinivibrionales bacterium]